MTTASTNSLDNLYANMRARMDIFPHRTANISITCDDKEFWKVIVSTDTQSANGCGSSFEDAIANTLIHMLGKRF